MKDYILEINECDFGSTGSIAKAVLNYFEERDFKGLLATHETKNPHKNEIVLSKCKIYDLINACLCRANGSDGFHNVISTKQFLRKLKKNKPSIIHLHNMHGHYVNLPLILKFADENNIPIYWTLHDCWSFTGRCPHFECENCYKWKESCGKCPNRDENPRAIIFDGSSSLINKKRELINKYHKDITIITPSNWLANYCKESLLKECRIEVINNGTSLANDIDKQYIDELTNKYSLENKKVLFFSASIFDYKKGITFVNQLADELDSSKYAVLLAGKIDSDYISKNIIQLGYLNPLQIRSALNISNVFINPTLQDNFPLVNIEALAQGVPVITFNSGGSPETINEKVGVIVKKGSYKELKETIINFDNTKYSKEDCITQASNYSIEKMCKKYFDLLTENRR